MRGLFSAGSKQPAQARSSGWQINAVYAPFLLVLFITLVDNLSFWRTLGNAVGGSAWQAPLALTLALLLIAVFSALLQLVNFPRIFKPVAIGILLLAAVTSYFMDTFGVVIHDSMIRNLMQTDSREAADVLTPDFFIHMLLYGVLPALVLLKINFRYNSLQREIALRFVTVVASLLVAGGAVAAEYKDLSIVLRQHREVRMLLNPVYPVYATVKYVRKTQLAKPESLRLVATDAVHATPVEAQRGGRLVVFVLGETARASEFSLNGYRRKTNPELAQLDIINYSNVSACGTATAESVPCIFSHLPHSDYSPERAGEFENVLDILQRTGVQVFWRDNNSGCKGVCERVTAQGHDALQDAKYCKDGECFDEAMLSGLQDYIEQQPGDKLIILHQAGSHGPAYYKRSPQVYKKFLPECDDEAVQNCSREAITNAYDNTILYTDHFLAETIKFLQGYSRDHEVAMLYVSDHGESLGENGVYLHGFPYIFAPAEQTQVPMVLWASPDFYAANAVTGACLKQHQHTAYSHDNIFHSLLGMFDINTSIYNPHMDLLQDCRA